MFAILNPFTSCPIFLSSSSLAGASTKRPSAPACGKVYFELVILN